MNTNTATETTPPHLFPFKGAECKQEFCDGRLEKVGSVKANVFGTSADETGYTVDVYRCTECEAEYYD
jgi:hypothetical protein